MGDDTTIELGPPLPELAQRATITFLGAKHGVLGRSRPVPRAMADRAVLRIELGSRVEERELDPAGVDAYLAEVESFRATIAAKRSANEATQAEREELAATRTERSAAIRPTCGYCEVPRTYHGLHHLVVAGEPSHLGRVGTGLWRPESQAVHLYSCPRCGSAEWFVNGPVDHPLGT